MNLPNLPTCEVCGAASVTAIVDAIEITLPTDPARCYRPHSKHFFCAAHARQSITYAANALEPASQPQAVCFTTRDRGVVRLLPLGGDLFLLQEVEMHLASHPRRSGTPDCWQRHECEVCGAEATMAMIDELDVTPPDGRCQELRPLLPVHYYCAQHERESVQVKTSELLTSLKG